MALSDIRKNRLKKLKRLRDLRINPYPQKVKRTHLIKEVIDKFGVLAKASEEIILDGRIFSIREHGGSTFIHFGDESGKMQAYFKRDRLGPEGYKFFLDNFDIGDFIEVRGFLFKTKRGEKTIEVYDFRMLAKSLLPLPEKWHGLKDVEERYRKRYLDLIFNPEVKKKFEERSRIIREIRKFLEANGFLEVETPILQPIYGGAKARPFKTHLNALDIDLYLRISLELYLKRLIVGGFGKIYEIGKCFRNEGVDRFHNPDFTMLEFYWAYADYKELMKFTEKMMQEIVKKIKGSLKIEYQEKLIDFSSPWPRIEFSQLMKKEAKINIDEIHPKALKKKAEEMGIKIEKGEGKAEIADKIYKKKCRDKIINPTFIIHHPKESFPLAKSLEDHPNKLANFQLVVGGCELVNAFSELNDPVEQRRRFEEQEKMYKEGFDEAQRMDKDFIEALEYGMPPCAGFGMGIDRFVALLTNSYSLREVILFPTMRPK
ncbi:lysine--tRNA ligase [bacterium]|nr:lysine--tRNA ligase [bacterium]